MLLRTALPRATMLLRTGLSRATQASLLPRSQCLRSPGGVGQLRRSATLGVDASLGGRPEGLVDRTSGVQPPRAWPVRAVFEFQAPTPMKKQPGGDGDKHDTVILRPRERLRVTELSPKDLKTALAKSIDNHSKYERCYRIRIQEVTNTIAVDTWLPHLAEHFLKLKTIRTPDKEIPVSTYL
ncbi:hypothetical protein ISCGN_029703 [Ixodes scapularis]